MKLTHRYRWLMMLLAAMLLAACSDDTPDTSAEVAEIRFRADVGQVMEGTRSVTIDDLEALQTEGSFTCTAYEVNSDPLSTYISPTTVDWNSISKVWEFNHGVSHYYWPLPSSLGGTYPSLDFFGYMPAAGSLPSYIIEGPTYSADHNVTFTCANLPMTHDGQGSSLKEFVYAIALGQNKSNAISGVPLTFKHPFSRIKFQLAKSHPDITINSITFKNLKKSGSCAFDGSTSSWTLTGDATDFVVTLNQDFNSNASAEPLTQVGTDYIMVPQTFAGNIEVNATWTDWGEQIAHTVSTTLPSPTNWQPGYSYTYTFTIRETDLIVNTEKYTEQW